MRRVILTICRRELRASWREHTAALVAIALATSTVSASVAFAQRLAAGVDAEAARSVEGADVVVRRQASLPTPFGAQRTRLEAAVVDVVRRVPGVGGATPLVEGPVRLATPDGRAIAAESVVAANWPDEPFAQRWTMVAGSPPDAPDEVVLVVGDGPSVGNDQGDGGEGPDGTVGAGDDLAGSDGSAGRGGAASPPPARRRDGAGDTDRAPLVGDVVTVAGNGGSEPLRVSGLVRARRGSGGAGRPAALLALPMAQQLVGQFDEVDQLHVMGRPGTTPVELVDQLAAALPPGVEARPAAAVAAEARAQARDDLRLVWAVLASVAGLAVLSGGFVVANTMRVGAAERRAELALLRLVGASTGQLRRLVLLDATTIGLLGALAGTALGLAISATPARLARAAGWQLPATVAGAGRAGLGPLDGLAGLGDDRWAFGWMLGLSIAVGALPTLLAALGPARDAAQASPLAAHRSAETRSQPGDPRAAARARWRAEGRSRRRAVDPRPAFGSAALVAGTALAAGVWWGALTDPWPAALGAVVLWGGGVAALAPCLTRPLAAVVGSAAVRSLLGLTASLAMAAALSVALASAVDGFRPGLIAAGGSFATAAFVSWGAAGTAHRRGGGVAARLARRAVADHPGRSGSASAGWTIGVAAVCAVVVVAASARASVVDGFSSAYRGDVVIDAGPGTGPARPGLDGGLSAAVRSTPGVAAAAGWRLAFALVDGAMVAIPAIEPDTVGELFAFRLRAGSLGTLDDASVAVSSAEARRAHLAVGDDVPITFATTGAQRFRVAAIFDDPGLDVRYLLSSAAQERHFAERADVQVFVRFDPAADRWAARQALDAVIAAHPGARVVSGGAFAHEAGRRVLDAFGLVAALVAFVVVVAVVGIANASALSVVTRRRELALLRLVGAGRGQLRAAIRWEAVVLALAGAVPGALLGVACGAVIVRALADRGVERVVVPGGLVAAVAAGSVVAGVAASLLPARRAVRLPALGAVASGQG